MSQRLATYFVPAAGIDREVITTDICRYLGNDALVKPGQHKVTHPSPTASSSTKLTAHRTAKESRSLATSSPPTVL
jgi:hypothetical protein